MAENGGLKSGDGAKYSDPWLALFLGKYVGLAYGTNDAWHSADLEGYYQSMMKMVEGVIAAGKAPVIPTVPWSSKRRIFKLAVRF